MTAPVLADALGPRARRRTLLASLAASVVLAAVVFVAVGRLADKGQLDRARWERVFEIPTLRFLAGGLAVTLKVAGVAMLLAMAVGALMALGRLARNQPVRWLAGLYVEFFRAMPLLLLILFASVALPTYGIRPGPPFRELTYLLLGLVIYNSAVLAEIFRAGILSLARGQMEAASALGLRYWSAMRLVVVPQAVRRMVPALVSQVVTLLKDTSLGWILNLGVTEMELLKRARSLGEFYGTPLQLYSTVAVVYIVINLALSRLARRLEVRQRRRYSAGSIAVAGVEDLAVMAAEVDSRLSDQRGGPIPTTHASRVVRSGESPGRTAPHS